MELSGEDLRIYRFIHGLSRHELAKRLGIGYSYLSLIETDKYRIPADREKDIREKLGLTDYRLSKLRELYHEMRQV